MKQLFVLTKRNIKLFFKDKGMFFTALITPLILLVLYSTFLGNVYKDAFLLSMGEGAALVPKSTVNALVGGQLVSSLMAVSCITVAFCSNMLMVQDKANGTAADFLISPVSPKTLALAYYFGTLFSTLIICAVALGAGLIYLAAFGWALSFADVLLLVLDSFLLVLFGTALSSVVNFFLSSQGQISAVGSIVSAGYGFISGAYMPISNFSEGLQAVMSFLPGTYGTALLRNHAMRGAFEKMNGIIPAEGLAEMKASADCSISFFGNAVSTGASYVILVGATLLLLGVYVLLNVMKNRKKK